MIGATYKDRYQGRIFGSPGYSVPPEILDSALMESPITTRLDIYAIGGAIFGLYTDEAALRQHRGHVGAAAAHLRGNRVRRQESDRLPPTPCPSRSRPVIEGCLERDPGNRFGSVSLVVEQLEAALPDLDNGTKVSFPEHPIKTMRYTDRSARISSVHATRRDDSITKGLIEVVDAGLGQHGLPGPARARAGQGLPHLPRRARPGS